MDGPIQQLIPPVLIISACGLLLLAQFSRYTSLIGRIREFHKQRVDILVKLVLLTGAQRRLTEERCQELEVQSHNLLKLVRLIRTALLCLVSTVMLMIASSLMIGTELLFPTIEMIGSTTSFVVGMLTMFIGMGFVFSEVCLSLCAVTLEHKRLDMATPVSQIHTVQSNKDSRAPEA